MCIVFIIRRELMVSLKNLAEKYPVVTLVGPRQSGKTTLALQLFPDYRYVNLEQTDTRLFAKEDPRGFLASNPPPVIIDKVHRCPELLSEIQVVCDSLNRNEAFILTGELAAYPDAGSFANFGGAHFDSYAAASFSSGTCGCGKCTKEG